MMHINFLFESERDPNGIKAQKLLYEVLVKFSDFVEKKEQNVFTFYTSFDASFAVELAKTAYIKGDEHQETTEFGHVDDNMSNLKLIERGVKLLQLVTKKYPSNMKAWIYLVKSLIEIGDIELSRESLENALSTHEDCGQLFLLKASIQIGLKKYSSATKSLDRALSKNLTLQNHPIFCYTKAKILWEEVRIILSNEF